MRLTLICLILVAPLSAGAHPAHQAWAAFLDHPTTENYRRIAKTLDSCRSVSCEPEVAPDSDSVVKLVGLVEKGQRQAIDLAFLCRRFLDGGDLEDVSRSLGMVADAHPRVFLEEVKEHRLPLRQLRKILRMMPESVIDDDVKRRAAVRERLRSLSTVKDPNLSDIRHAAAEVLRPLLTSLENSK
jgi:hypothetical protein